MSATSDYLAEIRARSFCGACEAGVEHDCRAYGRGDDR